MVKRIDGDRRLELIKLNSTMPRQIRRQFWKDLCNDGDLMSWKEYKELEVS